MSSNSYVDDCPKCNGENTLMCHDETRGPDSSGECMSCGYVYYTKQEFVSFEELNSIRDGYGFKPLTEKQFNKIKEKMKND